MDIHTRSLASLALVGTLALARTAAAEDPPASVVVSEPAGQTSVVVAEPAPAAEASVTVVGEPAPVAPIAPAAEVVWTPRFRIGIEAALGIPIGDWSNLATVALGGHLRFAWDPIPHLGVVARIGYLHGIGGDGYDFGMLPFMVGAEYRFIDGPITPFVGAELGGTIEWATVNTGFGSGSDTDGAFALAAGGGVRFGRFDVRADLYSPDVDDLFGVRVTVGGDFAVF